VTESGNEFGATLWQMENSSFEDSSGNDLNLKKLFSLGKADSAGIQQCAA